MRIAINKFLIIIISIVGVFSLHNCKESNCVEKAKRDCVTTQEYNPVCGCNGKTYGNKSQAECAGVDYTPGACK